jgi:hypothetical protein
MIFDSQLSFIPIGGTLAVTNVAVNSVVLDLYGQGVGTAPQNVIGNAPLFGTDFGIAKWRPELFVSIATTFQTATAATLTVGLQFAADQGAGGSYQPSSWYTAIEEPGLTAAQLVANAIVARFPWAPSVPANLRPRYARLLFTPASGTSFTAGAIGPALVTLSRDDQANKFAYANFKVA